MTPTKSVTDLSLFSIEGDLAELLALWQEPDLDEESRVAVSHRIDEYVRAEVRKVDGIAGAIRYCEAQAAEADRLAARAQAWKARVDAIKASALRAMQAFDVRTLETAGTKLLRVGNGGLQPLTVQDDLLPDEYRTVTVTFTVAKYKWLNQATPLPTPSSTGFDNAQIRSDLATNRVIRGAKLEPRGEHLLVK